MSDTTSRVVECGKDCDCFPGDCSFPFPDPHDPEETSA